MLMGAHSASPDNMLAAKRHNSDDNLDYSMEKDSIYLEISATKLRQLLVCGMVNVTDFRCLDHTSKCQVRALCLYACAYRLSESGVAENVRRYPERPS